MKKKLEKGDILLCYSLNHVEKAEVERVEGGVITLNNQVKVDQSLNILNSASKSLKVEAWDPEKYHYLVAKSMMDKVLYKLNGGYKGLEPESLVRVYDKLSRLVNKYF